MWLILNKDPVHCTRSPCTVQRVIVGMVLSSELLESDI